jgi:mannitol-1-/sugar-/sorbitol-6-phosphatase
MDGVLVDSRAVVERTWRRWAERHGLDPTPLLRIAHGRRTRETLRAVVPHLAQDTEVTWLDEAELQDLEGIVPVPGARELLAKLPDDTWAVVTSAGRDLAERRLGAAGLPLPRILVTSDDVARGKPEPDGYRLGAGRLGRPPGECLVFEDSPPGVLAGLAAGARVVGLATTHAPGLLPGVAAAIADFRAVIVQGEAGALTVTLG